MTSPSLPDHYASTFKYFLPVCGLKLQAKQIKNTKTILRVYIHDTEGVYRSLSTAKKAGRQLSIRFFTALASTNAGRRNCQEKKKDELPPAIGKNDINKNVSFLLTFYL